MNNSDARSPSAFISYSWEDDAHKDWVRTLGERLRADGIDAVLDQWAAVPGDQLPAFMENAISGNDFVLIICTPRYKLRSEAREGGVGYEGDIITGALLQERNHRKFIPVLRIGEWRHAAPAWLAGKYYVDLRDGPRFDPQYEDLLSTLRGTRPQAPPVTRQSQSRTPATIAIPAVAVPAPPPDPSDESVRILGVVVDEVTEPRNDGSPGSALYAVPFRLSRTVSSDWARVFQRVWDSPPEYTSMHRPGIARVSRDRITLNGTTIDEVQRYHRATLILCVKETNRIISELAATQQREQEQRARLAQEHKRNVRDIADRIDFG